MTFTQNLSDKELFLLILITSCTLYLILILLLPNSSVPLLVSIFVTTNMISRTKFFENLINKYGKKIGTGNIPLTNNNINLNLKSIPESTPSNRYEQYLKLSESSKNQIISAIKSLQSYEIHSKNSNDRRKKLFRKMSWRQQKLCEDVGYISKLNKIDKSIIDNQIFLNKISSNIIEKYDLSYQDLKIGLGGNGNNVSSTNYRVIETIGHFLRDWSDQGDIEIKPILKYINDQLDLIIPNERDRLETCILIPGSGLGKVAHELSKDNKWGSVNAIEYSGLMHICNEFIYSGHNNNNNNDNNKNELYPYIHSCSNFTNTESQFRKFQVQKINEKPKSLNLINQDFRYFKIPSLTNDNGIKDVKYKNIVVISVFFIDTAENLIDYFDTINELTNKGNMGYWINIGPLKYGSAAQVELNFEEINQIRNKMGWKDIDQTVSLNDFNEFDKLSGYITDKESLWQGYYGLTKWTSKKKSKV